MDHLIFESDPTDYGSDLMKTDQIVDCKIPSRSHLYCFLNLIIIQKTLLQNKIITN
jgi:hypothetical protein